MLWGQQLVKIFKSVGLVIGLGLLVLFLSTIYFLFLIPRRSQHQWKEVSQSPRSQGLETENRKKRLNELVYVGSHDSASYKFLHVPRKGTMPQGTGILGQGIKIPLLGEKDGGISISTLDKLQHWCSGCQRVLAQWTFTQEYDVYTQLKMGIRALDLRIAKFGPEKEQGQNVQHGQNGKYIYAHTLPNEYAAVILKQIRQFLDENPEEFIVISSKPDWENRDTMATTKNYLGYLTLVEEMLRGKLLPRANEFPTLGQALDKGYQVLFIYAEGTGGTEGTEYGALKTMDWVWPDSTLVGNWVSSSDEETAFEKYQNQVSDFPLFSAAKERRNTGNQPALTQVSLIVTMDESSIFKHYKSLLTQPSKILFAPFLGVISLGQDTAPRWFCKMREKVPNLLDRVNIWWVDAPTPQVIKAIEENKVDFC